MAACHLCAGVLFQGEFDSVECVSGNNMIHLKCAMVSFAADPNLLSVSCKCGETAEEDDNGARPVCGGFSGTLVDKAARAARVRGQEEALAHEAKMNALVEARTAMEPARYDSLPTVEEEVMASAASLSTHSLRVCMVVRFKTSLEFQEAAATLETYLFYSIGDLPVLWYCVLVKRARVS